jgi:hypothetical protein
MDAAVKKARPMSALILGLLLRIWLLVWGVISVLQGASIESTINAQMTRASWAPVFVYVVYASALIGALLSFVSARIAGLAMVIVTFASLTIFLTTDAWHSSLGLGGSPSALLIAIALRPVLAGLILFVISRSERTQEASNPVDPA